MGVQAWNPLHDWRRFRQDESGAVTVEAVLWLPFFFAVLVLITDVSFVLYGKAQAYRIIEAGNRSYAVKRAGFTTTALTQAWIQGQYSSFSPDATVQTVESSGLVSTTMTIPVDDLLLFGSIEAISDFDIVVRAQQYVEAAS